MSPRELRSHRKAMGLSLAELSMMLGLAPASGATTLREYERGKREITGPIAAAVRSFALLDQIERFLDLPAGTEARMAIQTKINEHLEPKSSFDTP